MTKVYIKDSKGEWSFEVGGFAHGMTFRPAPHRQKVGDVFRITKGSIVIWEEVA